MDIAAMKARELTPAVRDWVQGLLNKPLSEEDEISLVVRPAGAPTPAEREEARRRLLHHMADLHHAMAGVADDEIDAAVDEAQAAVRPGYVPKP